VGPNLGSDEPRLLLEQASPVFEEIRLRCWMGLQSSKESYAHSQASPAIQQPERYMMLFESVSRQL
jgi:hypothetical protein